MWWPWPEMGGCTRRKVMGGGGDREWERNFHCYFLMRMQYVLFNYPMRATCFAHLTNFYLISLTILGDQYKWRLSSHLRCGSSDTRTGLSLYTCIRNVLCCPVHLTGLCLQICFMSSTGLYIMRPFLKQIHFSLRDVTFMTLTTNITLLCYWIQASVIWELVSNVSGESASSSFRVEHSPSMWRYFSSKRWYLCTKQHGFTL